MVILVTGAFGFVGGATVTALLRAGHQVRAFDLPNHPAHAGFMAHWSQWAKVEFVSGDIASAGQVEEAVKGCQRVVHAAALLNSIADYSQFQRVNTLGTENVCSACIQHNVERLVLISTSDVFGIPELGETITEKSPLRSWHEPYADTKIEAVKAARYHRDSQSLPVTIIYPGWVYGPGDRQFFPAIMEMIKDKHVFTWERRNPYEINLVYIDDLVGAIAACLLKQPGRNGEYLILDTHTFMSPAKLFQSMADFFQQPIKVHHIPYAVMMLIALSSQWLARRKFVKKHLLSTTDVKAFGNEFHFNTDNASRELNWKPQMPVEEGIRISLEWHQKRLKNPDLVG